MRLAWGLALVLAATSVQAEVAVYTKGAVQIVGKVALGANGKRGFARFKTRARDFHGAFYVSGATDHAEWWVDEHRLDDAKTLAKANCEANDGADGACVLYAVIVPAGNPVGGGKVAKGINGSLSRYVAQNAKKGDNGSFGAAAANRVGKGGASWDNPTREEARKQALLACLRDIEQGGGADVYSDYVPTATYQRLLSGGRFDCKVVAEWQK